MNALKLVPIYFMLAAMLYIQIKAMPPAPEKETATITTEHTAPLPDNISEWTEEQMDDEISTYLESIETIKDEIRRRQRVAQRNEEKSKKQNGRQSTEATAAQ